MGKITVCDTCNDIRYSEEEIADCKVKGHSLREETGVIIRSEGRPRTMENFRKAFHIKEAKE